MLLAGVLPLLAVTDPPLLRYVTYVGFGSGTVSTAVDKVGSQYISGLTEVPWSPCGNEPVRELRRGMVTKLRPGGDGVVWTKCLAGVTAGVAVDGSGFVYVLSNFSDVATVTKLAAGDARVIYSRQIAGATATAIAVDRDGAAYVTGSAVAGLATTAGVYQGAFGPCLNNAPKCTAGFVAKIGVGGAVELATYTGIVGTTAAIGVDSQKSVWVAGTTSAGFGGIGWTRGFAVKFDSSLGKVLVGTGVKGGRTHQATIGSWISDMALDGKDAVYLTGGAPPFALNGTPGALQPVPPTGNMFGPFGFVWKLDSNGNTVYQTYLKTERGGGGCGSGRRRERLRGGATAAGGGGLQSEFKRHGSQRGRFADCEFDSAACHSSSDHVGWERRGVRRWRSADLGGAGRIQDDIWGLSAGMAGSGERGGGESGSLAICWADGAVRGECGVGRDGVGHARSP